MNRVLCIKLMNRLNESFKAKVNTSRNKLRLGKFEVFRISPVFSSQFCTEATNNSKQNVEANQQASKVNFDLLTNGDPVLERKLKQLTLEIENLRYEGKKVPTNISQADWEELMKLHRNARIRYLSFLFGNEMKTLALIRKKKVTKLTNLEKLQTVNLENHIVYGLSKCALTMRIYDQSLDNLMNERLYAAMFYSNDIIIDLSFESFMSVKESRNCAKQIMLSFARNRSHRNPLNLHLCNANHNDPIVKDLRKIFCINNPYNSDFPLHFHSESYLDLYPKDRLVYLSPDARDELLEYDPNDVYIIGAHVDKAIQKPTSSAKAKAEKLRSKKLPIDRFLMWKTGSKALPINIVLDILLDLNYHKDMIRALNNVPHRKLAPESVDDLKEYLEGHTTALDFQKVDSRIKNDRSGKPINFDRLFAD